MKTLRYIILIVLFFVACDRNGNDDPHTPCWSYSAPTPTEAARQTWGCMNMPRPDDSYNYYPEGVGLDESVIYQIPRCILKDMSTHAVIQTIWEHPRFIDLMDGGHYQTNFETLFSNNHSFIELSERKDAGVALLKRLKLVDPMNALSQALEILMAQSAFLSQLNDDEKKAVAAACVRNDAVRFSNRTTIRNRVTAGFLADKTMLAAGYTPYVDFANSDERLKEFLDGFDVSNVDGSANAEIMSLIIDYSQSFSGECGNPSAPTPCEQIRETWIGMNFPRPADSYNYPIYPGMAEWADVDPLDRDYLTKVPSCVLKNMSTQAVIQAIWEAWYFIEIILYSNHDYQARMDKHLSSTNTWKELITRKDAGIALLERLYSMDFAAATLYVKYANAVLKLFISHPVFLSQFDGQQKRKIIEICIENERFIGFINFATPNYLLMGRALYADGYKPFVEAVNGDEYLKEFIDGWDSNGNPFYYMFTLPDEVLYYCREYLNKH